jgi:hypothetical protein
VSVWLGAKVPRGVIVLDNKRDMNIILLHYHHLILQSNRRKSVAFLLEKFLEYGIR